MSDEHFEAALSWIRHFVHGTKTQREVNLAGIGESTLHPKFAEWTRRVRETVGEEVSIVFATNGVVYDDGMIRELAKARPRVAVSLHRPEKAGRAVEKYAKAGILAGVSIDPSTNPNDWAGQVKWIRGPDRTVPCQWLREGKVMVMADGRVTTCCLDSDGSGVIGNVMDGPETMQTKPYHLCPSCYQEIGVKGYDQFGL